MISTTFLMSEVIIKNSDGKISKEEYKKIVKQGDKINQIFPDSKFIIYCSGGSNAVITARVISDYCIQGVQIKTPLGNGESMTAATLPTIDHRLIGGNSGIESIIENHCDRETHLILVTDHENLNSYNSDIDWIPGTVWSSHYGLIARD
jgi:hypothetical protein